MNAPHWPDWNNADCHFVGIAFVPSDAITPYLSMKAGKATKLPFKNMSNDSMTCMV